jgi:Tol biopolymer transport system component
MLVLALLFACALPTGAGATVPGKNGQLLFNIQPPDNGSYEVATAHPDGSSVKVLSPPVDGFSSNGVFAPDGKSFLFGTWDYDYPTVNERGIFSANVSTSKVDFVWPLENSSGLDDYDPIAYSPDGQSVMLTHFNVECDDRECTSTTDDPTNGIWVHNLKTGDTHRINLPDGLYAGDTIYSPNGKQIAFTTSRVPGNDEAGVIYVANADGTHPRPVTDRAASEPSFSPDGKKIAFVYATLVGDYFRYATDVYTVGTSGKDEKRLTTDTWAYDPVWSPDGSKIAYTSYPNRIEQIYVMNADGSNQHNISHSNTYDSQPSWSPDGTKFAYLHGDTLAVMNADGTNPHTITTDNSLEDHDNYPSWSPDGRQITYQRGFGQIWKANADGTNQTNLSGTATGDGDPAWSPRP